MSESDEPKKKRPKTLQTEKGDGNCDQVRENHLQLTRFDMIYDRVNNMIADNVCISVKGSPSPQIFVGVVSFGRKCSLSQGRRRGKDFTKSKIVFLCPC